MTDKFTITVEVEKVTDKLLLRKTVGEGDYDGHSLELCVALPDMSPILQIDNDRYMVSIHSISEAICEKVLGE